MMMVIVTYDVAKEGGRSDRYGKVVRICRNYGRRVQGSVFECILQNVDYIKMKAKLMDAVDRERDSLRFYIIGSRWEDKVVHVGVKGSINFNKGPLIV